MFTGLIETVGVVKAVRRATVGMVLSIDLGEGAKTAKIGDSICVSGVCLTVSKLAGSVADFDVSHETLERTTAGKFEAGTAVNIEQAMRADGRFGGHVVQGHVDGVGKIKAVVKRGEFYDVTFSAVAELLNEMVVKGSVAVDGISLTVARMDRESFSVAVIPVTWEKTTLGKRKIGDTVNIETDILIKAIRRQMELMLGQGKGLTLEKLTELGFGA